MLGIGGLSEAELGEAARTRNQALARLSAIQWQQSFLARDVSFCLYLADSEAVIREHARLADLPADRIVEITGVIDPTAERFGAPGWTSARRALPLTG